MSEKPALPPNATAEQLKAYLDAQQRTVEIDKLARKAP